MTKTILVTGSEGIIGRAIVCELAARRPEVKVVRVSRAWSRHSDSPDVQIGDLRDCGFVRELLSHGVDTIIHAAALPYDPGNPEPFGVFAHDVEVTLNVLGVAREVTQQPRHHVFLSSAMVYETVRGDLVESATDSAIAPSSPIALAKFVGERAVRMWCAETGGTHTIWRLFNVVSPEEPHNKPGHIIVDLYYKIFVERQQRIEIAHAERVRSFTWIDDIAAAIVDHTTADNGRAALVRDQTFNLGAEPTQARNAYNLALQLYVVGRSLGILPDSYTPIVADDTGGLDLARAGWIPRERLAQLAAAGGRVPSVAKARDLLGWHAPTSFADCIDRFVRGKVNLS